MKKDVFIFRFYWFRGVLILLALTFSFPLHAGWLIVEKKEDRFGNFSMQSMFIEHQKVRVESPTSTFIFDLENKNVTLVFNKQLVYWSGSAATLKDEFMATIEQQIEVMIEQMSARDREKARVEFDSLLMEMRKAETDSLLLNRFTVTKSDSITEIVGHKARQHFIQMDTTFVEEVWISDEIKPFQSISLKQLTHMMQLFSRPTILTAARESPAWEQALENGIVLRSILKTPFGKNVMEVTQLRETPIRAEVFLPPDNYRKIITAEVIAIMMGEGAITPPQPVGEENWKPMLPAVKPNAMPSIFPPKAEDLPPF